MKNNIKNTKDQKMKLNFTRTYLTICAIFLIIYGIVLHLWFTIDSFSNWNQTGELSFYAIVRFFSPFLFEILYSIISIIFYKNIVPFIVTIIFFFLFITFCSSAKKIYNHAETEYKEKTNDFIVKYTLLDTIFNCMDDFIGYVKEQTVIVLVFLGVSIGIVLFICILAV